MEQQIWAFDLDQKRFERLAEHLAPKYHLHLVKDPLELPSRGEIDGIILDTAFGRHFCEAMADYTASERIPLFVWAAIGGAAMNFHLSSKTTSLLPLPFDIDDVRKRLDEAIAPKNRHSLLIATTDENLADLLEHSLGKKGWGTPRASTASEIRQILSEKEVEGIICGLGLAENIRRGNRLEPRKPLIIAAPFEIGSSGVVHLDELTTLVSTSLNDEALTEAIENTMANSKKAELLESGFLKALEEADLNAKKTERLTQLLIDSARDATSGRREEELNLLNTQTDGLVTELFDMLKGIIKESKALVQLLGPPQLTEELFDLDTRVTHAEEVLEALRSVAWFKKSGPIEPINLGKIISHAATKVRANRRRKDIEWDIDLTSAGIVPGNRRELEECFINILTNAYESIGTHGKIAIESSASNPKENIVTITDTGAGMGEEILQSSTQPFFTTKTAAHAGLGLTVAKGIIEYYNGEQTIESIPGQGTRITIKLPRIPTDSRNTDPSHGPDLLIVAHKRTLGFLEAGLVRYGWHIEMTDNIGEALQITKKMKPRLILVLAALGYMDIDGLRMLAKYKGDARLVLLDPTESIPEEISGLDSTIRGSFPLHHLLAIVNSYIQA